MELSREEENIKAIVDDPTIHMIVIDEMISLQYLPYVISFHVVVIQANPCAHVPPTQMCPRGPALRLYEP